MAEPDRIECDAMAEERVRQLELALEEVMAERSKLWAEPRTRRARGRGGVLQGEDS